MGKAEDIMARSENAKKKYVSIIIIFIIITAVLIHLWIPHVKYLWSVIL